ncbi:MAG: hypothetical protein ABIH35_03755 [Patescibacteria group bacterium]
MSPVPSFRQRRVKRLWARVFRRRRQAHLEARIFRGQKRLKDLLTLRQKILLVIVVISGGALIGFTHFSGFFDVTKVSVARSSLDLPLKEIELAVRERVLGKNIFSIDRLEVDTAVREMRPDIAHVRIRKKYPREIAVEVFKFPIVAELRIGTESVFINENGHQVVGDTPDRDTLRLHLGEGETVDLEDPTRPVISVTHLSFIRDAVFYFESLTDFRVLNVKYFPVARELHLKSEKNFDVWLDFTQDYRVQLNKLVEAADVLRIGSQRYEYIDLRVRGKIFYKARN